MKNKKIVGLIISIFYVFCFCAPATKVVFAEVVVENIYSVYDENGVLLLQKQDVFEGDSFLTKDFKKYEIIFVDDVNKIGRAKFIKLIERPDVNISFTPKEMSAEKPIVCLYMTHNDESYLPSDGVDSVYGEGGIHDVANHIKTKFELNGVTVKLDETLHIPHDSYAYSRSKKTANKLIEDYKPDAIFDIHRDGASRKTYVKTINGKERCKVRIVVGKSSTNFEIAEQFALYLMTVAEKVCDWLFLDIYYASGHYNQGLHSKALLFEMGSHLVEKELVLASVEPLVNVINTALFNTTVNNNSGELTINGNITEDTPLVNDALETKADIEKNERGIGYVLAFLVGGSLLITLVTISTKKLSNKKD